MVSSVEGSHLNVDLVHCIIIDIMTLIIIMSNIVYSIMQCFLSPSKYFQKQFVVSRVHNSHLDNIHEARYIIISR